MEGELIQLNMNLKFTPEEVKRIAADQGRAGGGEMPPEVIGEWVLTVLNKELRSLELEEALSEQKPANQRN